MTVKSFSNFSPFMCLPLFHASRRLSINYPNNRQFLTILSEIGSWVQTQMGTKRFSGFVAVQAFRWTLPLNGVNMVQWNVWKKRFSYNGHNNLSRHDTVKTSRRAVLSVGSMEGSVNFQKNYNFILTKLCKKFGFSFYNECRQQGNLCPMGSKNVGFVFGATAPQGTRASSFTSF